MSKRDRRRALRPSFDGEITVSKNYRPATQLVHGGTTRTPYGETSEALFLTSGFVYDTAAQAERTFAGTETHYQYSRFGNPTVTMLEQRLALLEGAEACRATATGMAAVHATLMSHLRTGAPNPCFLRSTNARGITSARISLRIIFPVCLFILYSRGSWYANSAR